MDKRSCVVPMLWSLAVLLFPDAHAAQTVDISGVVYAFNTPTPLAGATVSVVEQPEIATQSDASGNFKLSVPDQSFVTLVATKPGYRTMYSQTFEPDGENLDKVFIQFVPQPVYEFLAGSLGVDPNSPSCQIVTTVSVEAIQGLAFPEFIAYTMAHDGHGDAGASVSIKPEVSGGPIYFNEQVLPDPSRTLTSRDGGVLFVNVPPGHYKLSALKSGRRFASAHITCEPGRFINASPPWGLAQKRRPAAGPEPAGQRPAISLGSECPLDP